MSKRVMITLPDGIAEALERWAKSEGNKAATLAAFIVETEVRTAMSEGRVPDAQEETKKK